MYGILELNASKEGRVLMRKQSLDWAMTLTVDHNADKTKSNNLEVVGRTYRPKTNAASVISIRSPQVTVELLKKIDKNNPAFSALS